MSGTTPTTSQASAPVGDELRAQKIAFLVMVAIIAIAPVVVYPIFMMKVMCFALFACAFNLLIGFGGLLSFGHAMFLGSAGYVSAHAAKVWGLTPELAILCGTAAACGVAFVSGYWQSAGKGFISR